MNFSIHVDDTLIPPLEGLAKKTKKTRNSLINEAIRHFLEGHRRSKWPQAVLELAGAAKNLSPFESSRSKLKKPPEDPFA